MFNRIKNWYAQQKLRRQGVLGNGRKRVVDSEFLQELNQSRTLGIFIMVILWGVFSLLLSLPLQEDGALDLKVGDVAPETILPEFEFEFTDSSATEKLRGEAEAKIPVYYLIREPSIKESWERYRQCMQAIGQSSEKDPKITKIIGQLSKRGQAVLKDFYRNEESRQKFEQELSSLLNAGIFSDQEKASCRFGQDVRIINTLGHERIREPITKFPDVSSASEHLADAMLNSYSQKENRDALKAEFLPVCRGIIGESGDLVRNEVRTQEAKQEAVKEIAPVRIKVQQQTPVLSAGTKISRLDLDRYKTYFKEKMDRERGRPNTFRIVRNAVWSFLLSLFVGFYMWHLHPDVVSSNRKILLFSSIILLSILAVYGTAQGFLWFRGNIKFPLPQELLINILPLSLASVLLAVTMGFRAALFGGFLVSGFCAMLLDQRLDYALEAMFICAFCALAVRNAMDYRNFFVRTFLPVFIANCLLEFNLLDRAEGDWEGISAAVGVAAGGALLTGMGALLLIFFYELFFRVDTNMSLMVLCTHSHPLLERMKREAPGTFFHSLMVATIAEDAARSIGANPLKAKVGAMFHDIGKLSKPQYFTENNLEMGNQHTDLKPQVSSIIIRGHIKEGQSLAREWKLSRVIVDAIEQHHGTDFVHYFYQQALKEKRETRIPVTEAQYRYQGTPPRDKEMAIISLADACEAACRAQDKPNASRIESQVDEIFRNRFQDGQLSNAALTLAELQNVRDSFVNDLISIHHGRIAYQKENEEDVQGDLFMAHGKAPEAGTENTGKAD